MVGIKGETGGRALFMHTNLASNSEKITTLPVDVVCVCNVLQDSVCLFNWTPS